MSTEAALQTQVTQLAEYLGWHWAHFRPARTTQGWRTPVSGPLGEGFPDLVLVRARDRRLMFVELKSATGRLRPRQRTVLDTLGHVAEVHVLRPQDMHPDGGRVRALLT